MTNFLDEKRDEIGARLKELKPLVDEYERLQAAVTALEGVSTTTTPMSTTSHAARASKEPTTKAAVGRPHAKSSARRGRPKGSARGVQALQLVKDNPGITARQIVEKMGINQDYLYRVLRSLADDGLVARDGRGWRANGPGDVPPTS